MVGGECMAPTCQVLLQRGRRGVVVPAVAAEEEQPEQEGGQDQDQDPQDPSHGRVGDGPGSQDVHAAGQKQTVEHFCLQESS